VPDLSRAVLLTAAYEDWHCPACGLAERIPALPPNAARMHVCPRLHMVTAPMVRAGADCKLVADEREDYLGGEVQETGDDGRPYMAVRTVYADGRNDVAVHAPLARARLTED
jgi:hypothetical protein